MYPVTLIKYRGKSLVCRFLLRQYSVKWTEIIARIGDGGRLIRGSVSVAEDPRFSQSSVTFSAVVPSSKWETAIRLKSHEWAEITEFLNDLEEH